LTYWDVTPTVRKDCFSELKEKGLLQQNRKRYIQKGWLWVPCSLQGILIELWQETIWSFVQDIG
jgi:hypothetical protein